MERSVHGSSSGLVLGGTLVAATATQLNYTSITTPGNAEASKAVVLSSNRDISNIRSLTATQLTSQLQTAAQPLVTSLGTLTGLSVSGDVTITGALNLGCSSIASSVALLSGVTAGTATAGKALITNANNDINGIRYIGATQITLGTAVLTQTQAAFSTGITIGTAAASKALVLDASGNIADIAVALICVPCRLQGPWQALQS